MTERLKDMSEALDRARRICREAHAGQQDKTGGPFIEHVERVVGKVEGAQTKTIAYLHDVVEKGRGWTLERLRQEGFSAGIVAAVDSLTRRSGEAADDFARRAASNPLACPVKRADLEDNLWQARQAGIDTGKYERGLEIVREIDENQHERKQA